MPPPGWQRPTPLSGRTLGYSVMAGPVCGIHLAVARGEEGEIVLLSGNGDGPFSETPTGLRGQVGADALALGSGSIYIAYVQGGLRLAIGSAGAWASELVDPEGGTGAIVTDSHGTVHVAYAALEGGLRYARRAASSSWIHTNIDSRRSFGVAIAATPEGAPHVSYAWRTASSVHDVAHATNAGGAWASTSLQPIDPLGELGTDSGVAVGPRGVHLAYQAFDGPGGRRIRHALLDLAGTYTFETVDDADTFGVGRNPLTVDAAGHAHLVYRGASPAEQPPLRYASDRTGEWVAETIPTPPVGEAAAPMAAVDAAGAVHVVFFQDGGLYYTRRGP